MCLAAHLLKAHTDTQTDTLRSKHCRCWVNAVCMAADIGHLGLPGMLQPTSTVCELEKRGTADVLTRNCRLHYHYDLPTCLQQAAHTLHRGCWTQMCTSRTGKRQWKNGVTNKVCSPVCRRMAATTSLTVPSAATQQVLAACFNFRVGGHLTGLGALMRCS